MFKVCAKCNCGCNTVKAFFKLNDWIIVLIYNFNNLTTICISRYQKFQYSSSNLYRYNGKEEQQIAGTELAVLDYGARTYDPWLSRWTSIDPLAAKYYSTSPYVFCNNSPVSFVDPFGMDIWEINRNGEITWSERSEEHRLYAVDSENNRSMDYIVVKNSDILSNLEGNGIQYYTSAGNIDDFFKVFLFAADNSDVEWALHRGKDNMYTIGSSHLTDKVASYETLTKDSKLPVASVHSHPNDDTHSMGYDGNNYAGSDLCCLHNGKSPKYNYVYFPDYKSIYLVGWVQPVYIKHISNYKGFFFGTLNHK